ncbi:molybdopterin-dependent oxidoreductase [Deinococcus aquaticus]|uniref:molybdopterin-dependent oxidoreductase n=1 Tax=Deinococcus aquaticus TaxID=328692 RepID=UPI00360A728D
MFGSGSLTNEKTYLLGKFARVALQTPNIDYNGRYCMASASAALNRTLGIDRGLGFPLSDMTRSDLILLVGANIAETLPRSCSTSRAPANAAAPSTPSTRAPPPPPASPDGTSRPAPARTASWPWACCTS